MNTKYIVANPVVVFMAVRSLAKRGMNPASLRLQMSIDPKNNAMTKAIAQSIVAHEIAVKRDALPRDLSMSVIQSSLSSIGDSAIYAECANRANLISLPKAEREMLTVIAADLEDIALPRLSFNPVRNNPLRCLLTVFKMQELMNKDRKDFDPALIRNLKDMANKLEMELPSLVYTLYYTEIVEHANNIFGASVQAVRKGKLSESDTELHRIHRQILSIKQFGKYVSTTWADMTNEVTSRLESKQWTVSSNGNAYRISFAPSAGVREDDSKEVNAA